MVRFTAGRLHRFVASTLEAAGLSKDEATHCADAALFADLRGTDTHGALYIIRRTLDSIKKGQTVPGAEMVVVRETAASALVRGNGMVGPAMGHAAMTMAVAKATQEGVGLVSTYQGGGLGLLGYYPALAAEQGLIGLAMANTSPAVAPFGASTAVFGTNPVAYAAPAREHDYILFDMATSEVASGKLQKAIRRGESIPAGWAIDSDGRAIDEPKRVADGALLPFGGHKGSGIALLVHLMTGALSGTTVGGELTHDHPDPALRGQGALFMVVDPDRFCSRGLFDGMVDRQIDNVHAARPLPGRESVLVPGERGWRERARRLEQGIDFAEADWNEILGSIERFGLPAEEILAQHGPALAV